MKWLRIATLVVSFAVASYAQAAEPEAYLGKPANAAKGARKAPAGEATGAIDAGSAASRSGAALKRYGAALGALKPERRAATRGAAETKVYETASPSVVLVISAAAFGSGAVISPDGKIVTNLHVVGDSEVVGVILKPAQEGASVEKAQMLKAKVVRRDEPADLALIQLVEPPANLKPLALASLDSVKIGADVHAIGHPTGESWTYTRGIVSQVRRDYPWTAPGSRYEHKAAVIQTQTPINPGNSGGPLLNEKMEVIGINSFKTDGEGLNFAVSADDVRAMLALSADRTATRRSNAPGGVCKEAEVTREPTTDPAGTEYFIDADCDDESDFSVIVPNNKREALLTVVDTDGDRRSDAILVDKNRDGHPETGLYDTDGDGKADMLGTFRKGEAEPFRWEKISGPK